MLTWHCFEMFFNIRNKHGKLCLLKDGTLFNIQFRNSWAESYKRKNNIQIIVPLNYTTKPYSSVMFCT